MLRFSRLIGIGYLVLCFVTLGVSFVFGPLGYAPFALVAPRVRQPVTVTLWYSPEKRTWLEAATKQFLATNPTANGRPIQISLRSIDSGEMIDRVAAKNWGSDAPPTAISPASSLWIDQLRSNNNTTPIVDGTPQPLVQSPLVLLGWEERTSRLFPSGVTSDVWKQIHDVLANNAGWSAYNGQASWGPVKFGRAAAQTSNSGVQTLILMAYGYTNKTSGLTFNDVQSADFRGWLGDILSASTMFTGSSNDLVNDMLRRGPSTYDMVTIDENLAIESLGRTSSFGSLHVYYPPATLISDHPFATLQGDWTTSDERAAATVFRDFLLSRQSQELAVQSGFRPVIAGVAVTTDNNSPFTKYQQLGIQADLVAHVETPTIDVVKALVQGTR